jgi:hypothetical protein
MVGLRRSDGVHVIARYGRDPAPCLPLPAATWAGARRLTVDEMTGQINRLTRALDDADNSSP